MARGQITEDGEGNDNSIESSAPPPEYLEAMTRLKKFRETWEIKNGENEIRRAEFQAKFGFSIELFDAEM